MARFRIVHDSDSIILEVWQKTDMGGTVVDKKVKAIAFSPEAARIVGERLACSAAAHSPLHSDTVDDLDLDGISEEDLD